MFLLQPNVEGLIRAMEVCASGQWAENVQRAKAKDRVSRDLVLTEAAKEAMASLRECLRVRQPGLAALAKALTKVVPRDLDGESQA